MPLDDCWHVINVMSDLQQGTQLESKWVTHLSLEVSHPHIAEVSWMHLSLAIWSRGPAWGRGLIEWRIAYTIRSATLPLYPICRLPAKQPYIPTPRFKHYEPW